jgi:hypothetical protein
MNITLVTYSHTDYADIWPMVVGQYKKQTIQITKIFACNKTTMDLSLIESVYDRIIFYDESLTYPMKLKQIAEQVKTKYLLLIHDIDVCMSFRDDKVPTLIKMMDEHSIDRLMLGMVPKQEKEIVEDEVTITNANKRFFTPNFITPYDVSPSIWNCECLIHTMELYKNETYRSIEMSGIQSELLSKNIYAIAPNSSYRSFYQIGRPFCSYFSFLHILVRGKWFDPKYYMDYSEKFEELVQEYSINCSKRGLIDGSEIGNKRVV